MGSWTLKRSKAFKRGIEALGQQVIAFQYLINHNRLVDLSQVHRFEISILQSKDIFFFVALFARLW